MPGWRLMEGEYDDKLGGFAAWRAHRNGQHANRVMPPDFGLSAAIGLDLYGPGSHGTCEACGQGFALTQGGLVVCVPCRTVIRAA